VRKEVGVCNWQLTSTWCPG